MSTAKERAVGAADSKESGECLSKAEKIPEINNLKIDDSSIPEENKSKYDSEAESFDEEEYKLWLHEMGTSGGFDLTVSPRGVMGSYDIFNDVSKLTHAERQKCDDYVKMAIKHYNKREVNISYGGGMLYYLTFEAKEAKCGSVGSYQAEVLNTFKLCGANEDEIQVLMCRKKPGNSDLNLEEKS